MLALVGAEFEVPEKDTHRCHQGSWIYMIGTKVKVLPASSFVELLA